MILLLKNRTSLIVGPIRWGKRSMKIISCAFLTTSSDQLRHSVFFVSGEINSTWSPNCSHLFHGVQLYFKGSAEWRKHTDYRRSVNLLPSYVTVRINCICCHLWNLFTYSSYCSTSLKPLAIEWIRLLSDLIPASSNYAWNKCTGRAGSSGFRHRSPWRGEGAGWEYSGVAFQIPCGQNIASDVRLQSMVFSWSKSESLNCQSNESWLLFVTKQASAQV